MINARRYSPKVEVDRRTIVERANADVEDVAGDLARLARQPVDEVGGDGALRQDAGAAGGEPQQVGCPSPVDLQEGVEYRGDQDRADARAALRRLGVVVVGPFRLAANPFLRCSAAGICPPSLDRIWSTDLADVVAQRAVSAGRLAELNRELSQQILLFEIAAGLGDLVPQALREA